MVIELYKTTDDNNVVKKNLTNKLSFDNVTFHNEKGVSSGTLTLQTTTDLSQYNYMYIPKFKRYYYISVTLGTTNLYNVGYRVDVLKSFYDEYKNIKCTVKRNENRANGYLIDENYKALSYKKIVTKTFPHGLTDDSIILLTVGN